MRPTVALSILLLCATLLGCGARDQDVASESTPAPKATTRAPTPSEDQAETKAPADRPKPVDEPSAKPVDEPSAKPADEPSAKPADEPSAKPADDKPTWEGEYPLSWNPAWETDFHRFWRDLDHAVSISGNRPENWEDEHSVSWTLKFKALTQNTQGEDEIKFDIEQSRATNWINFYPDPAALPKWKAIEPGTSVTFQGTLDYRGIVLINYKAKGMVSIVNAKPVK